MGNDTPEDKLTPQQLEEFNENIIETAEFITSAALVGTSFIGGWAACSRGAMAGSTVGSAIPGLGTLAGAVLGCAGGLLVVHVGKGFLKKLPNIGLRTVKKTIKGGINKSSLGHFLEPIQNGKKTLFPDIQVLIKDAVKNPIAHKIPFITIGAQQAYQAGIIGHSTNDTTEKKDPPKEDDEQPKAEKIQLKTYPTTDYNVNLKEKTKIIRPLGGIVTPRFKLLYFNKVGGETHLADLSFYLRIISISWLDADEANIPSITVTCAYHPHILHFDIGTKVVPLIGTHEGTMVSLGVFYLNKVGKTFTHGSFIARLGFAALDFKNSYPNTPTPKAKHTPKKATYMDELKKFEQTMKFKLDIEDAKEKLNQENILNIDNNTTTPLHRISQIVKELELSLTIKNKTLIIRDKASDKKRISYQVNVGVASHFDVSYELSNAFHTVQVISSKLTKDKKEIIGIAHAKGIDTVDQNKVMTIYEEVKNKEEATKLAKAILNRVNTSIVSCTMTIPNCILFAGHNLTVDQNLPGVSYGEYPLHLRITKAQHDISATGWTCALTLQSVQLDYDTERYQKAQKIRGIKDEFYDLVKKFQSINENQDRLKSYLKAIDKKSPKFQNHKDRGQFIYNWLYRSYIHYRLYPDRNHSGIMADDFIKSKKEFEKKAAEIDKKLKDLGDSLATSGLDPDYYVQSAFDTFSRAALSYFGLVIMEDEKQDKG